LKVQNVGNCAMTCKSPFFRGNEYFEDKSLTDETIIEYWLTGWTVGCFTVCLVTCLTFIINPNQVEYPERPIVYLSFCYFAISGTVDKFYVSYFVLFETV
jgi:hypothetical protein